MKGKLKVPALALVAILAAAGVVAATGSAQFQSEVETTTVEGGQTVTHTLTFNTGAVTCKVASLSGGMVGGKLPSGEFTAETLKLTPEYKECENALLGAVTFNANGCQHQLKAGTPTEAGTKVSGELTLTCPAGKELEFKRIEGIQVCTVKVPPQTVNGISYHNTGSGKSREVDLIFNLTTMKYSQSGFLCIGGTGSFTNGKYTGSSKLKGKDGGGSQVGIRVGEPSLFDSEKAETTVSGEQIVQEELLFAAGSVACEFGKASGTLLGTEMESGVFSTGTLTVTPTYEGCDNPLLGAVEAVVNGCDLRFVTGVAGKEELRVVCPEGKKLEFKRPTGKNPCTIAIPSQNVNGVSYQNKGSGSSRTINLVKEVTTLEYTQTGIVCPGGQKTFTGGVYAGTMELKGSSGGAVGIWVT